MKIEDVVTFCCFDGLVYKANQKIVVERLFGNPYKFRNPKTEEIENGWVTVVGVEDTEPALFTISFNYKKGAEVWTQ